MTRKSRQEIERAIERLREDQRVPTTPVVMERARADAAGYAIQKTADGTSEPYQSKFRAPPAPDEGEDLVVALVPVTALGATFCEGEA